LPLAKLRHEAESDLSALRNRTETPASPKMPIQSLPVELINAIFTFCSPRDLAVLALVNTSFQSLAVPLLYHDLWATDEEGSTSSSIRLLRILASGSHLSKIVRRYKLHGRAIEYPMLSLHRLLRQSFRSMENLEILTLDVYGSCADVFADSKFQLDSVAVMVDYDGPFIGWLEGQLKLTRLHLKSSWGEPLLPTSNVLSHNALPNLRVLSASPTIVAGLAPGRPLNEVGITSMFESIGDWEVINRAIPALRSTTSSIGILVLDIDMPDADITQLCSSIASNIPRLEELGIVLNRFPKVSLLVP
jgi:hypothetical protein